IVLTVSAAALDVRVAPVTRPPAARVPVPPVGQIAAAVRRPGHDVRDTGRDRLVTARAPIVLLRRAGRHGPHHPVTVAGRLHALDAPPGPLQVERFGRGVATNVVATRTHF